jgi:hypothetical protein
VKITPRPSNRCPIASRPRGCNRSGPCVRIDETRLRVLEDEGATSQLGVRRGGEPWAPTLMYAYHPSRSGGCVLQVSRGLSRMRANRRVCGIRKLGRRAG